MTRVEARFKVEEADARVQARLRTITSIYGILRVNLEPEELVVEYDATRLQPKDVAAVLARAGIAARPAG